jgi:DNA-binding NarL/FixJ family response regulator
MPGEPPPRLRVLIVDDRPVVRLGLRQLLETSPDLRVCGEVDSAMEAVALLPSCEAEVAIVDIALADGSGLDVVGRLTAVKPGLPVLVISAHDERLYAERAIRAGARGYASKRAPLEVLLRAVRTVASGRIFASDDITQRLLERVQHGHGVGLDPLGDLTDRELQVFELVGEGVSTAEIADRLHVSVKTIETYRANIKAKLGLSNGSELVRYAASWANRL